MKRAPSSASAMLGAVALCGAVTASAAPPAITAERKNIELVGHHDLQGRGALQVTVAQASATGNGDFVYVGFHPGKRPNPLTGRDEFNGTMIIDISDPTKPRTVLHIPNEVEANSRAVQVVHDYGAGRRDYLIRNFETETVYKFEIFDITDRMAAVPRVRKVAEITGTPPDSCGKGCGGTLQSSAHKGWWSAKTGYFYAAANEPGFRGGKDSSHLIIWDLSDPRRPKFVGRNWLPGQKDSEPDPKMKINLHHPIVDEERQRVYAAFHRGGDVVAYDISALLAKPRRYSDPKLVMHLDLQPPGAGNAHTIATIRYPAGEGATAGAAARTYALVAEEAGVGCGPIRHKMYMLDLTDEAKPTPVSTWQVPEGDFCFRGGRFGPHQFAETVNGRLNRFEDRLAWVAYFNAGIRLLDLSDPRALREVGFYLPEPAEDAKRPMRAIQMNDVDLDDRGLAYASDREGAGLYILRHRPE